MRERRGETVRVREERAGVVERMIVVFIGEQYSVVVGEESRWQRQERSRKRSCTLVGEVGSYKRPLQTRSRRASPRRLPFSCPLPVNAIGPVRCEFNGFFVSQVESVPVDPLLWPPLGTDACMEKRRFKYPQYDKVNSLNLQPRNKLD